VPGPVLAADVGGGSCSILSPGPTSTGRVLIERAVRRPVNLLTSARSQPAPPHGRTGSRLDGGWVAGADSRGEQ